MTPWASSELISRARTGDEAAVEQLIAAIWPRCFRLAASVIGDPALAQDAAQEACAIVYRRVKGVRDPGFFGSWLYRIVLREAQRTRRRAVMQWTLAHEGAERDDAMSIDVWRALAALPPQLRDVTVLFYFDDLRSEEIASVLHVAHATVRTRLFRARERLCKILGDYAEQPRAGLGEVKHDAI